MLKSIVLFVLTNLLVVATISIATSLLGLGPYLTGHGLNYETLLAFCLMWGMGGSVMSLLLSKKMTQWMCGVHVIDPQRPGEFGWLVERVYIGPTAKKPPHL